jgi:hypothetical protein
MATYLDNLGNNQFIVVRDINHPRQELLISADDLVPAPVDNFTVFEAIMSQTLTNAPIYKDLYGNTVVTPIRDTIGGVWTYYDEGKYRYTKTDAFVNWTKVSVTISANTGRQGASVYVQAQLINDNVLELQVGTLSQFASPSLASLADGKLVRQHIIITCYN